MKNTNNFESIIKLLDNDKNQIVYIEEGRYLNTYFSKNEKIKIWIPVHPASLYQPLKESRIEKYIHRWLDKRNIKEGWLIYNPNSHWNYRIIKSIRRALMNYQVVKTINHKNLKAELLQKK